MHKNGWSGSCGGCGGRFGGVVMCFAVMLLSFMLVVVGAVVFAPKFVIWHIVKNVCVYVVALLTANADSCCGVVVAPVPPFPGV